MPLIASGIALRNPKRASYLLLSSSPITLLGSLTLTSELYEWGGIKCSVALWLVGILIPAIFWQIASRKGWPIQIQSPWARKNVCLIVITAMLVVSPSALLVSFCLPWHELIGDCDGGPILDERGRPVGLDFTAKILYVGPRTSREYSFWSIARIDERFSGVPARMPDFVVLRGFFRNSDKFHWYFVEGHRGFGPLTRFLPVVLPLDCGRTSRLEYSEVPLRILRERSPRSGVRLIGTVYKRELNSKRPEAGIRVLIEGTNRKLVVLTDSQGIYDVSGLPSGRYNISLADQEPTVGTYDLVAGDAYDQNLTLD